MEVLVIDITSFSVTHFPHTTSVALDEANHNYIIVDTVYGTRTYDATKVKVSILW